MTRSVRRLAAVILVLLLALLANLTYVQFFAAADIRAKPGNTRTVLEEYSRERGPILLGSVPIASSVPTDDSLRYLRQYSRGPLYAPATGFYSIVYGATGIERTENAEVLRQVGLTAAEVEDMYRYMAIANYEDRFVIPTTHREHAENAYDLRGGCGFSFESGCSTTGTVKNLFGGNAGKKTIPIKALG